MGRLSLPFLVHCSCSHRRLLHEPLVPVDWNALPSPSLEFSYPQSTLPPPPPTGPIGISAETNQAHPIKRSAVIGIAVCVMLLGLVSFCAFLVYRRLNQRAPESERLVGGGRGPRFEAAPAARQPPAPVALYLGTEAPAVGRGRSREQRPGGGSPYEKFRAWAGQLPSPELHPLPALHPSTRNSESAVASLSSDEYYTPNRSAASESPSSVTSAVGKDIPVCAVDRRVRSRRSSPRSRLSNSSSSDVKRVVVAQSARPPPPPPPPPLPKPKATPAVPSLPTEVPVRPSSSSRRQWVKPASQADVPVPLAKNPSVAKPRLKPLHWDKVRASSDREMVWDQLKSSSFQLDEDMFVTLFCNSTNGTGEGLGRRPVALSSRQENHRVLDPKKSHNIAILLRALNVTTEEVTEALLEGDPEGLGTELLETLVKMAPSKEEELKLKDYSVDISKLGSAELFLKAVLDIPFAFQRVDAMLYRANFDTEVDYLRKSFKTLEVACDELKGSRLFLKLLEAVLRTGNRMNVGTNRGEAKAFKLDALLKLADVKGVDGKITLLHFVVQEIIRSEGSSFTDKTTENSLSNSSVLLEDGFKKGLRVVAGLGKELVNVKLAASMDSSVLSSYVSKLESGLDKIKSVLQLGRVTSKGRFFESMNIFLGEAEKEVGRVKAEEKSTFTLVKEITEYFHGNAAKEEAHPFRIFMVVRDFQTMLDNVCREVERMQTSMVGSARSFRMSTSVSLPVLNRFDKRRDESSGDESSSS